MLGNSSSEKTLLIPTPPTNQWSQNRRAVVGDPNDSLMAASDTCIRSMNQKQQQQQPLKCPRCDSSNTKFCYYNNYSLSQPRHFCKACKRYWTRGGTLRNVPVGGGCRKNRRVRRPSSSSSSLDATPPSHIDGYACSNRVNPYFYGLTGVVNPEINHPVPRFVNSHAISGYDLHHSQLSALGLGFITTTPNSQISNSLLPSYGMFGSSSSGLTSMTTFLGASDSLQQRGHENNPLQSLVPFDGNVVGATKEARNSQTALDSNNNTTNSSQNGHRIRPDGEPEPTFYWNTNNAATTGSGGGGDWSFI